MGVIAKTRIIIPTPGPLVIDMIAMNLGVLRLTAPGCKSFTLESIDLGTTLPLMLAAIRIGVGGWLFFDGPDIRAGGVAAEWHTAAEWAGRRIRGLTPSTAYAFEAKAKYPNCPIESSLVPVGTYTTNVDGDVNRSGTVTIQDVSLVTQQIAAGGQVGVNASWAADVNDDRIVDAADRDYVLAILFGP